MSSARPRPWPSVFSPSFPYGQRQLLWAQILNAEITRKRHVPPPARRLFRASLRRAVAPSALHQKCKELGIVFVLLGRRRPKGSNDVRGTPIILDGPLLRLGILVLWHFHLVAPPWLSGEPSCLSVARCNCTFSRGGE